MALWNIHYENGNFAGSRNSGETAEQAVNEWNIENARPICGIRFHDELPITGIVRNIRAGKAGLRDGKQHYEMFCDYYPTVKPATNAVKMREIWIDCGYARIPWVDAV